MAHADGELDHRSGMVAAFGLPDLDALAREIGIPRAMLTREVVMNFAGGVMIVCTENPSPRRRWAPNPWTVSALRRAGILPPAASRARGRSA